MDSSVLWFLHNTLTNGIRLFRNSLTSRAKISIGSSSYVKSGLSSIVSKETTCDGSDLYLLHIDTWKTLWIFSNFGGKANLYATGPIFSVTSYGPMNLVLIFENGFLQLIIIGYTNQISIIHKSILVHYKFGFFPLSTLIYNCGNFLIILLCL